MSKKKQGRPSEVTDKTRNHTITARDCEITKARIISREILGDENISGLFRFFINNYKPELWIVNHTKPN